MGLLDDQHLQGENNFLHLFGDKYRQQVPETAPQKHGGDKVGGSEEAGDEDAEN